MKRVALVTGGMGGIGTAICQTFFNQGINVIATYNHGGDHKAAYAWQEQQKNQGFNFDIHYVDVMNYDSCVKMIQTIESKHQQIDILVNNAGIVKDVQFYKMDLEHWQTVIQTNLNGVFNVTRPVINGMIDRSFGRIINISSINAQKGQFGQTNYAASKAGIHGFTKSLAQEVAIKGITVNTVSPGYIATQMILSVPKPVRQKIIEQIPVKRFGTPEEVAYAVSFLASEKSAFITGSNLMINGGQYLL